MGRFVNRKSWPNNAAPVGRLGKLHGGTEKVRMDARLHCGLPLQLDHSWASIPSV
jgi:hypothetical protein